MKWQSLRRRWKAIALATFAAIVIGITFGPQLAKPIVRAKLQALIADDFDATVEIGWITWHPPFGVNVHSLSLRATDPQGNSFDLLRADQIAVSLRRAPWSDGPIDVQNLKIDSASLHLIKTKDGIVGLKHNSASPQLTAASQPIGVARKISDRIQLHHFNLSDANVDLEDRTSDRPPIALHQVGVNMALAQQSTSQYAIEVSTFSGAAPLLHAEASFDIDRMFLSIDPAKLKFSPGATETDGIKFDGGGIIVNLASRAWGISDLKMRLLPGADASGYPAALVDLKNRLQPAGRIDCVVNASGPIILTKDSINEVSAEIDVSPANLMLHPIELPLPLTDFANITIHVHDGVASAESIRAGYGEDVFFLQTAALPLKNIFDDRIVIDRMNGCVTLAKQPPKYPEEIEKITALAQARGPFWFTGSASVDLNASKSPLDYSIRLTTDRATIASSQFHIPLYNVNADLLVTPAAIDINRFDADVLSGKLSTSGRVNLTEMSYAAQVRVRRVDLNTLAQTAAQNGQKPITVTGELNCDMNVAGKGTGMGALAALNADGAIQIQQGEMFRIPGLMKVADIVHLSNIVTVGDAAISFQLKEKKIHVDPLAIGAPAIGVNGSGDISIVQDEAQKLSAMLDINLVATPFSDWEKNIRRDDNPVANVAGEIAGAVQKGVNTVTENLLYKIHVSGPVQNPKVEPVFGPDIPRQ